MKKLLLICIVLLAAISSYSQEKSGCVSGNCENGFGTFIWDKSTEWAGHSYTGEWKNGNREGNGVYTYGNGKYIGQFKNNQRDGEGTYIWDSGDKFVGQWKEGKQHGNGIYYYPDGTTKSGYWENDVYQGEVQRNYGCISGDCKNGYGVYTWDDGEKYEGFWANGKRNGQGTNYYSSGNVYTGNWKDNQQDGYGSVQYSNGDKYDGEWKLHSRNGFGTYIYSSGKKYVGDFSQGKFHGQGTMYYTDGTTKSGQWQNDNYVGETTIEDNNTTTGCVSGNCTSGYGKWVFADGESYQGNWENGKRNGQGKNIWAKGMVYEGEWKDNLKHGFGTYTYEAGSAWKYYSGDWIEDAMTGKATLQYANGNKYVGSFVNGNLEGEGTMYYADKTVKSGIWSNSIFVGTKKDNYGCISGNCSDGYGVYSYEGGEKYEGNWQNGSYSGKGTFFAANGDKYVGNFKYGSFNGQGTYTYAVDSRKYVGEWKDGVFDGQGTMYYATGEIKSGLWKAGEYVGQNNVNSNPPAISWLAPEYFTTSVNTPTTIIRLCIESNSELTSQQVYVNDQLQQVESSRGFNVVSAACDYTIERTIKLNPGENKIKVVVANKNGKTTSDVRTVTFGGESSGEKRLALIIGNSDYVTSPLKNPANDAKAVGDALKTLGFEVMIYTNAKQDDMKKYIRDFGEKLAAQKGTGLFYYAGHGMQVNGENFLIPVDARIEKEQDVEFEAVNLRRIMGELDYARCDMNIVILDACRNNPFARSFRSGGGSGLATTTAPQGTFIAYATAPGSVAADGTGQNGLYTQELLDALRTPGLTIENVFKRVRTNVFEKSGKQQVPWENSSIFGDFYFKK